MKRNLAIHILVLFILGTSESSFAIGPQLEMDCGIWENKTDSKGRYRELTANALYSFSGPSFEYEAKFYNSAGGSKSRATFLGSYEIENPENRSRQVQVPIPMKFRNNSKDRVMFNTRYIRGEFKFKDIQGFEAYSSCIWKWR